MKNVFVICGGVVEKDNKILLVQEKKESAYKRWNLAAGRLKFGEDIISATKREVKEETGYDVEIIDLIGIYENHQEGKKIVGFAFRTKIIGGELKIDKNEHFDAKWFTKQEMKNLELRDDGVRIIVEDYFKGKSYDHKKLIKKYV